MGDLVSFPRAASPARSIVAGESAAILFFTGVRYHRDQQAEPPIAPAGVKRRRSTRPRKSRRAILAELHG